MILQKIQSINPLYFIRMCENMRNENLIRSPFQYDVTSLDKKPDNFIIIV